MSFGSGLSEKDAITDVKDRADQVADLSTPAASHSKQAYKFFKHSAKPALQYWTGLLGADTEGLTEFLSPELNAINQAYSTPLRSIGENAPRGGGSVSAVGQLQEGQARAVSDLFGKARPTAARELGGLAGTFGGVSQGFGAQAIEALQNAGVLDLGALGAISAGRARTSQFWGDIGEGVGSLAGGWLGGK